MTVKRITDEEIAELRKHLLFPHLTHRIEASLSRLLDEVEASRTLLRRIEWSARVGQDSDPACPECQEWEPGPHAADCELAALIDAARLGR